MTVDLERSDSKHWHFALGPVERWVVGIVAVGFIAGLVVIGNWFIQNQNEQSKGQKEQGEKIQTLVLQQAVANGTLSTITTQLTDVPQLRRDVVELKVRVDNLEQGQRELRQTRGAR